MPITNKAFASAAVYADNDSIINISVSNTNCETENIEKNFKKI